MYDVHYWRKWMTEKTKEPDPVASAMAQKRWDKATDAERAQVGKDLAEARWGKKGTRKAVKKAAKKGK
jgi:hypothetical protein